MTESHEPTNAVIRPDQADPPIQPNRVNGARFTPADSATRPDSPVPDSLIHPGESPRADSGHRDSGPNRHRSRISPEITYYMIIIGVATYGGGESLTTHLDWPLPASLAAMGVFELGGLVISRHADSRARIGERARGALALAGAVAAVSMMVNFFGHAITPEGRFATDLGHLFPAVFFAGTSLLGFLVYRTIARSRGRDAVTAASRRTARMSRIAGILRREINRRAGSGYGELAAELYDPDRIAVMLAERADYATLADIVGERLTPTRLAGESPVSRISPIHLVAESGRPESRRPGGANQPALTDSPNHPDATHPDSAETDPTRPHESDDSLRTVDDADLIQILVPYLDRCAGANQAPSQRAMVRIAAESGVRVGQRRCARIAETHTKEG